MTDCALPHTHPKLDKDECTNNISPRFTPSLVKPWQIVSIVMGFSVLAIVEASFMFSHPHIVDFSFFGFPSLLVLYIYDHTIISKPDIGELLLQFFVIRI